MPFNTEQQRNCSDLHQQQTGVIVFTGSGGRGKAPPLTAFLTRREIQGWRLTCESSNQQNSSKTWPRFNPFVIAAAPTAGSETPYLD